MANKHELEKLRNKYIKKIMNASGISGSGKLLGCGSYGCAYEYGNKVLKLTLDKSEVEAAAKLMQLKDHKNIYKIFNVYKLGKWAAWAIIQEKLNEPDGDIEFVANSLINEIFLFDEMNKIFKRIFYEYNGINKLKNDLREIFDSFVDESNDNRTDVARKQTEQIETLLYRFFTNLEVNSLEMFEAFTLFLIRMDILDMDEVRKKMHLDEHIEYIRSSIKRFNGNSDFDIFDQIASAVAWLYRNGIKFYDIHAGNVMQKSDGTPALIDLGVSKTEGNPGSIELLEGYIRSILNEL